MSFLLSKGRTLIVDSLNYVRVNEGLVIVTFRLSMFNSVAVINIKMVRAINRRV